MPELLLKMLNSPLDPPEFAPPADARSLLHLDWARLVASDCQDTRFLYLIRIGILDFIRVLFCLKLLDFRFDQFDQLESVRSWAWVKIVIGRLKISNLRFEFAVPAAHELDCSVSSEDFKFHI